MIRTGWSMPWRVCSALAALCLIAVSTARAQPGPDAIGEITAIQRTVSVVRAGSPVTTPLATRQPLLAADTVETGEQARVQALFRDDTMLTLGQRTRVEISEFVHDPGQHVRRMTVTLAEGTMRALVGREFPGLGSTFVIRAGRASVVANAAYCVVWKHEQETGVVNVGSAGAVSFVQEGRVVVLAPGSYAIAKAGQPPGPAEPVSTATPAIVRRAIGETEAGGGLDTPITELVEQEIEEELRSCPPGSPPGGICPRKPPLSGLPPATPPAVTSGAVRK
jgi:hypothetical protein